MSLKGGFSRFFEAAPDRLHFAAHSHHPWPDVSFEAHQRAWLDAARLADDKWEPVFGELMPATRTQIASALGLSDPDTLVFSPNTHDLLVRIFSSLDTPVHILTSDAEFHSFTRQSKRWEEAGLAIVDQVSAEPFDTFAERFTNAARTGGHGLVYLSHVFFDSGFVVPDLDRIVSSVSDETTPIVIDGYHAFMAFPVHLGSIQDRVFYLAGGYKYAMSGEGVCFLHSPPGHIPRPVDTGWYAGFVQLESGIGDGVAYSTDGSRFSGATFDVSGVYRMNAVLGWLESEGVTPESISKHVKRLQDRFLNSEILTAEMVPPQPHDRGNFLTFHTENAEEIYRTLHDRGVITDYRRDRLRVGFGVYNDTEDVDSLIGILRDVI